MYNIVNKYIYTIFLFIVLLVSIETQTYSSAITHGIVASKNNTLNNAFQKYRLKSIEENAEGVNTSKHSPINSTVKKVFNIPKDNLMNPIFKAPSNLSIKIAPPTKGVYQSAITDFGGSEDNVTAKKILDYEKMIGKKIVWAYFSNNWGSGIKFPEKSVRIIHSLGVVPFIRMMPRTTFTEDKQDPNFTLQSIIDGKFDSNLTKWAMDAKRVGIPLMVEFGTEVNGHWFPWSGIQNGGGITNKYGNPTFPDGPERFRDAYRHIIDLFRKEGVTNITWCFHVYPPLDVGKPGILDQPWNAIKNYYPGDNYIDWIGISVYGSFDRGADWESFSGILDNAYPQLAAISSKKPLAVFEFGVLEDPLQGNKSKWIQDALQSIENGRYPRIKAISYWDEKWNDCVIVCLPKLNGEIDLRLNSSTSSLDTYRKIISSPFFLTNAQYQYKKNN
jgi:beta-mannanase